jgi:eukaryotic-like serine/threonine-protein kinase
LDFGLARLRAGFKPVARENTTLTQEGTILGTFQYMAPEQVEGKESDARTDIFAFGSVLYEMLSGHRAFQRDTKASTIAAILKEEPKPVSQIVEACLARWSGLSDAACGKIPSNVSKPWPISRLVWRK